MVENTKGTGEKGEAGSPYPREMTGPFCGCGVVCVEKRAGGCNSAGVHYLCATGDDGGCGGERKDLKDGGIGHHGVKRRPRRERV